MYDTDDSMPEKPEPEGKLRYTDADFLRLVADERRRSVGFGEGDTGVLQAVRVKAQEYRQGQIRDLAALKGRSNAVDTSLSEAIDTIMPDVMEVFFGGDDVVTFEAYDAADEPQAKVESDAVNWVVFSQNDAFRAFHDAIQDALLNRTGVFHWWWEEDTRPIATKPADDEGQANAMAALIGQQAPWAQSDIEQRDDGTFAVNFKELRGKVCFKAIPSEDFTVAADTVTLRDTTYCALRDRPRVQDLIARGVDKALARSLPHYTSKQDQMSHARDEAGENDRGNETEIDDLRVVEVRTHYLRVDADDDGDVEIWRIETDGEETIFLQKELVTQVPFGALTPYLSAHRFYGESLYDKLHEVMRIKTVLLRMMLDSGYFALNQRMEVGEEGSNEFTISDLLNNAPNVPVRSRTGTAVRPLQSGQLGFDVFNAMEFMSTVAEQRSGVVRNAQGLNPDTLHETAQGAMQLINAAQKRVRMICRVFAETGVKDLFLGVHQMLREQTTDQHAPMNMKAGQQWQQVRPDQWREREALTVHVGVGSAGREKDLQTQGAALNVTKEVIQLQGGTNGPFVTGTNLYNRLKALSRAAGEKNPELYWSDPAQAPPQPPQPHPDMLKLQAQQQLDQAKLQGQQQIEQVKIQGHQQIEQAKIQANAQAQQQQAVIDARIEQQRMMQEMDLKRQQMAQEMELDRQKAAADLKLQYQEMLATIALKHEELKARVSNSVDVDDAVEDLPG